VLIGDYASADKWLSLALAWNPADCGRLGLLGRAKYNENRFEEPFRHSRNVSSCGQRYALARGWVGLSYEGLNRHCRRDLLARECDLMAGRRERKSPNRTPISGSLEPAGAVRRSLAGFAKSVGNRFAEHSRAEKLGKVS